MNSLQLSPQIFTTIPNQTKTPCKNHVFDYEEGICFHCNSYICDDCGQVVEGSTCVRCINAAYVEIWR